MKLLIIGLPETTSGDAMREVHGSSEAGQSKFTIIILWCILR